MFTFTAEGAIPLLPTECLHGEHGGNTTSFLGMFPRLLKNSFTVIQIVSPQEYYMHTNYYQLQRAAIQIANDDYG